MPIYEYACIKCKTVSTFLVLRASEGVDPYCKACGSKEVKKIVSRISILRSEEKRLEGLLDPSSLSGLDENNPSSIERVMKKIGKEMGDELGDGLEESIETAFSTKENSTE